ncbi:MAG: signal recognition particle subunit SRP19/SEC65 family protein [Candidatus Helarchaeota archaeon]
MKNKGFYIIWPQYFDSRLTRKEGRRVNKKSLAVKKPNIKDLIEAAQSLGFEFKINPEALYPRFWYMGNSGYLLIKIDKNYNKTDIIKKIALKLKKLKKKER